MNWFITGVNGFVGHHLTNLLLKNNHKIFGNGLDEKGPKNINYHKTNILDFNKIKELIEKSQPDIICHLAGFSSVKKSFDNPKLCHDINVNGTENILKAVKELNINPRIIIISSADLYGIPQTIPMTESHPLNAKSPYAESRIKQEAICKKYNLNIVILRSFPHIGPGQLPQFVTSSFAKQIADIEKGIQNNTLLVGNLSAKRDFTDVRDTVKAYYLAASKCKKGETYNICSQKSYSIQKILDILISLSKEDIKIKVDKDRLRPSDIPILEGDNTKFIKETGWVIKKDIEETLLDILDYWRNKN